MVVSSDSGNTAIIFQALRNYAISINIGPDWPAFNLKDPRLNAKNSRDNGPNIVHPD